MFLDATPHGNHMPENLLGEAAWEPNMLCSDSLMFDETLGPSFSAL